MDDEHSLNTDGADLIYHLKKHEFVKNVHPQEVRTCTHFLDGYWAFDSNVFWFYHPDLMKVDSVPRTLNLLSADFVIKVFKQKVNSWNTGS